MAHSLAPLRAGVVCSLLFTMCSCAGPDRIEFGNAAGDAEIGVLLDGQLDGTNVNDHGRTLTGALLEPGELKPGRHDELVAFQSGRAPAVDSTRWKDGQDERVVTFGGDIPLNVQFWLLASPSGDRQAQVMAAVDRMNQIWARERMGLRIGDVQIVDRTDDPAGQPFLDFTCSAAGEVVRRIGFADRRLNFYYVDRIDFGNGFSTGNGVTCGGGFIGLIAMGRNASAHLAAHEAGHAFDLDHVNDLDAFDRTNVMHNASNVREYLTEGQVFRAHVEPFSFVNRLMLRVGQPIRQCEPVALEATDFCPAIQRRIWADGTFPVN